MEIILGITILTGATLSMLILKMSSNAGRYNCLFGRENR